MSSPSKHFECHWQASRLLLTLYLAALGLALPLAVVLRFRLVGERRVRSLCIPRDALTRDAHRRLRVRLKFSRRRWAAPG